MKLITFGHVMVSVKENEASVEKWNCRVAVFCIGSNHTCISYQYYLNKVLVFLYLILPFSFKAFNSEWQSATEASATSLYCKDNHTLLHLSVTVECTTIPWQEFLICKELNEISHTKVKTLISYFICRKSAIKSVRKDKRIITHIYSHWKFGSDILKRVGTGGPRSCNFGVETNPRKSSLNQFQKSWGAHPLNLAFLQTFNDCPLPPQQCCQQWTYISLSTSTMLQQRTYISISTLIGGGKGLVFWSF